MIMYSVTFMFMYVLLKALTIIIITIIHSNQLLVGFKNKTCPKKETMQSSIPEYQLLQYAWYRDKVTIIIVYPISIVIMINFFMNVPYTVKLSSGKTFKVRVQNFHSWENLHASMLVDLHCQLTRP